MSGRVIGDQPMMTANRDPDKLVWAQVLTARRARLRHTSLAQVLATQWIRLSLPLPVL